MFRIIHLLRLAGLALALSLTGCGGGGSGGSSGSSGGGGTSGGALKILLDPASIDLTQVQGYPTDFAVDATASGIQVSGNVYIVITDKSGVIDPNVAVTQNSATSYSAVFATNSTLGVGAHKGDIEIQACSDLRCGTVYGSTILPYQITVSSNTNLTPLTALAGVGDWQTAQGDAAHDAYAPVSLNPSKFTTRWIHAGLLGVVTDATDGLFFGVTGDPGAVKAKVNAFHETDGTVAWSSNLSTDANYQYPSAPAFYNGRVYATYAGPEPLGFDVFLAGFDAGSGARLFSTTFYIDHTNSCGGGYCGPSQPVGSGGSVFVNLGSQGGSTPQPINAYDAVTGGLLWTAGSGTYFQVPPAADSLGVYFYSPDVFAGGFFDVDPVTGATLHRVGPAASNSTGSIPALDGVGGVIVKVNDYDIDTPVARYDIAAKKRSWLADCGSYVGDIAVANGVLYCESSTPVRLQARSITDGHLLWSWFAPASDNNNYAGSIVVTKNLVFVSADERTYAISISTQTAVWSYPIAGKLAISPSGILYISGGVLAAVNLH